jgi:hypothetical protein
MEITWCESCLQTGERVPATGHSRNPDWSGYDLCDECQGEYNSRPPVNQATVPTCDNTDITLSDEEPVDNE